VCLTASLHFPKSPILSFTPPLSLELGPPPLSRTCSSMLLLMLRPIPRFRFFSPFFFGLVYITSPEHLSQPPNLYSLFLLDTVISFSFFLLTTALMYSKTSFQTFQPFALLILFFYFFLCLLISCFLNQPFSPRPLPFQNCQLITVLSCISLFFFFCSNGMGTYAIPTYGLFFESLLNLSSRSSFTIVFVPVFPLQSTFEGDCFFN